MSAYVGGRKGRGEGRRKVEVTTSSRESVHAIMKHEIPFMHKAIMSCNGPPIPPHTHTPTSHPSLDQQLIVSTTGIDFMTMCHS